MDKDIDLEDILGKTLDANYGKNFNENLTKRLLELSKYSDNLYSYSTACYKVGLDKLAGNLYGVAREINNTMHDIQGDYKKHVEEQLKELKD